MLKKIKKISSSVGLEWKKTVFVKHENVGRSGRKLKHGGKGQEFTPRQRGIEGTACQRSQKPPRLLVDESTRLLLPFTESQNGQGWQGPPKTI